MMAESGGFDELRDQQPPGMESARAALEELVTVARESYGMEHSPLVLAGFSQGAMLSVDLALRGAIEPPQGLVIYSGALLCESAWRQGSGRLAGTRVFQSHGTQDMILPIETGRWLHELIQEKAIDARWFSVTGPHPIPMQGVDGMMELLVAIGPEKA
jgi:phospholipase/carboxylesterase